MTPPRRLWHVHWRAARRHDKPNDRIEKRRNYAQAERAGEQVASLRPWIPSHIELVGVWVSDGYDEKGITWSELDPDTLPVYERPEWDSPERTDP